MQRIECHQNARRIADMHDAQDRDHRENTTITGPKNVATRAVPPLWTQKIETRIKTVSGMM